MAIRERSLILFTLSTVNFTHIVDSMLIMPLGDIFIELFEISASEYSYLVSAYALAAFFSSLAGVFFLDRFDRKRALLFIYTGFAAGTFLCAFAEGLNQALFAECSVRQPVGQHNQMAQKNPCDCRSY